MPRVRAWLSSKILTYCLLLGLLVTGGYFYLFPGSLALLEGRTDVVMSDGTDSMSQSFGYDMLKDLWQNNPSRFFYGAIYYDGADPEKGTALWYPLSDRWLGLLASYVFPVEQVSTAYVYALIVLNGLCMFLLCSYLGWARAVGFALSFAWAVNCYVRARAKVHTAMVGIYHLPLIFLGVLLVVRGRSWRSLLAAMVALLLAGTTAHYYLVTCVFMSPLFVIFALVQPGVRARWKKVLLRFTLAVLPLIGLLAANFYFVVPPYAKITSEESKSYGVGEADVSIFQMVYAARPIDYLGGDIALQNAQSEINPLRALVNRHILANLGDGGNPHERTNGIRWTILILSLAAFGFLISGRIQERVTRNNLIFFLFFGFFGFWLSLAPDVPAVGFSPSYWLYHLFPKIRVPARAGIMVHFGLLMVTGFFLAEPSLRRWKKVLVFPGVLFLLLLADYPPLEEMPMAKVAPAYSALHRSHGPCGVGMIFPFVSASLTWKLGMYYTVQRMRGSDCPSLNAWGDSAKIVRLEAIFPPTSEFIKTLSSSSLTADTVERLVRCTPLNWLVFLDGTPVDWAGALCQRLGWSFSSDLVCVAPVRNKKLERQPDQCL